MTLLRVKPVTLQFVTASTKAGNYSDDFQSKQQEGIMTTSYAMNCENNVQMWAVVYIGNNGWQKK